MIEPYSWQRPIIDAITNSLRCGARYAINASGTGAGKTVMALASAKDLFKEGIIKHVLVIAPKVSLSQWVRTAEGMGIAELLLGCINPEQVSKPTGCAFYNANELWKLPKQTLVIWDEPHRSASGIESNATRAMATLKAYPTVRLLAMSATLADSPLKLRALGFWAGFHNFTKPNFFDWCYRHGCAFESINGRQVLRFTRNRRAAQSNMEKIRRDFGHSFVAIPLADIPNFPEQTLEVINVDLSGKYRREVDKAYSEMSERMRTRAKTDMAEIGKCRERIEFCKADAVVELALSHLSENKSVVIFCNYTSARERIEDKLQDAGIRVGSVYGGQKDSERQGFIDAFQQNTIHAMIVMTAAGGAALSLHDVLHERPRVSLITPSFNAAEVRQALGRIRRCNGTNVEQYFVLAAGTLEDQVSKKLSAKLQNIDSLNDSDLDATGLL